MKFKKEEHLDLYNILLTLSRNKFFYKEVKLPDKFETRVYLMFIFFSIFMIIFKKKNVKFDQYLYDQVFKNIEYNLRELGFGDVYVNKKMKDLNKILYDILLKLEIKNSNNQFSLNYLLIAQYFTVLKDENSAEFMKFKDYFTLFYNFCFDKQLKNMLKDALNFIY